MADHNDNPVSKAAPAGRRGKVSRFFLAAFVLILLGGMGYGGFLFFGNPDEPPAPAVRPPEPDAGHYDIEVTKVRHNALRKGVLAWTVDAESVGYSRTGNVAKIRKVSAVFYGNRSRQVKATALEGEINTGSRDMALSGDVVINDAPYVFKTGRMEYKDETGSIATDRPVSLSGGRIAVTGDSLTYDINTRTTRVTGHVKGLFFLDRKA